MLHLEALDAIEQDALRPKETDIREGLEKLNKCFATKVAPENGMYGVSEIIKDNGIVERLGKNELGHAFKEYFFDGKLFMKREVLGGGKNITTLFDDAQTGYFQTAVDIGRNGLAEVKGFFLPDMTVRKGNFSAVIDAYGRPVLNRIEDLQLKTGDRERISVPIDESFQGYHRGHIIADMFDGPGSAENIVAQLEKVNLGDMKRVENTVKRLKQGGHRVDYEVKVNYIGTEKVPTSFEPRIVVDGKVSGELSKDLRKIFNEADLSSFGKTMTAVREKYNLAHKIGGGFGLEAVAITLPVSIAENVSAYFNNEVSAEEMVSRIIQDTGKSGIVDLGTNLLSKPMAAAFLGSTNVFVQKLGQSCLPIAGATLLIDSWHNITDFLKGEIDGVEFANNLMGNAVSIGGSIAGGTLVGSAFGSAFGPVGTAAGCLIGGVLGSAVMGEIYTAAMEVGGHVLEVAVEQMDRLKEYTLDCVAEYMPEKLDEVTAAFHTFFEEKTAIAAQA